MFFCGLGWYTKTAELDVIEECSNHEFQGIYHKGCYSFEGGVGSSAQFIKRLKSQGIAIGEGCYFFDPQNTSVDTQRPHLLTIGDNVKVASGAIILTHDYSRAVCIDAFGVSIGNTRETKIGNNVFIGMNAILLMGCEIGDNSIVGAGAVVSGQYPPNSVIGGNPAKVICSLDKFREKQQGREREAALLYARRYYDRFGNWPTIEQMTGAFAWLYLPRSADAVAAYPGFFKLNGVNRKKAIEAFMASEPKWPSFEAFLEDAKAYRAGRQDC